MAKEGSYLAKSTHNTEAKNVPENVRISCAEINESPNFTSYQYG